MDNPFPGMNPYMEQSWGDVHTRLMIYICDQIQARLPNDLRARVEERVLLEPEDEEEGGGREVYPDVLVMERGGRGPSGGVALAVAEVAEPLVITLDEQRPHRYIEIVEAGSRRRVVTAIEVLSPSNKRPGLGQKKYLQRQAEFADAGVSLVEIDLLRAGHRLLGDPALVIPASYRTTYQVCVNRAWRPLHFEIYRAPLRERLPKIRVPLRRADSDVPLDLQAVIDQSYRNGRYDEIDYRDDPAPPLDPADAAWADALLKEKGLRP